MKRILGLVVAGGLWLGMTSAADAQFSMSIGNPYYGGFSIAAPYAGVRRWVYGAPYAGYGVVPGATFYSSGYAGVYPGVTTYSSGYYGVAPWLRPAGSGLRRLRIPPVLRGRGLSPIRLLRRLRPFRLWRLWPSRAGASVNRVLRQRGPF